MVNATQSPCTHLENWIVYLYEPLPAKMRRLTTPSHVMSLTPESERIQYTLEHGKAEDPHYYHRSSTAVADQSLRLKSNYGRTFHCQVLLNRLLKPKTLSDCCRRAQQFIDEHDLGDGLGAGEINLIDESLRSPD